MVFQNFSSCGAFLSSSQARWILSAQSVLCIILLHWLQCLKVVNVDEVQPGAISKPRGRFQFRTLSHFAHSFQAKSVR